MTKNLKATHEGTLKLGEQGIELPVAVLNDGTRIISSSAIFRAFGRTKRGRAIGELREPNMPSFIDAKNLRPFINSELMGVLKRINFTDINGKESSGYDALILPLLCKVYHDARNEEQLKTNQIPLARVAEILLFSLSKVGIIALVDEATGYEKDKNRDALQKFLDKFLENERGTYVRTFPDEFFETIYKMKGWDWKQATKGQKPGVIGTYINDFVWSRIAPTVLEELKARNPRTEKGYRKYKHPQFINPKFGHPLLKEHLHAVIALGRASGYNWKNFQRLINRAYPKFGETMEIDFKEPKEIE